MNMRLQLIPGIALVISVLISPSACAQVPGARIAAEIQLVDASRSGDTTHLVYRIRLLATSPEKFFSLSIPLPRSAVSVRAESPPGIWETGTRVRERPVAQWALLDPDLLTSDSASTRLHLTAIGIPVLTEGALEGYHEPYAEGSPQADSMLADTTGLRYGMTNVRVVGIGSVPSATSASAVAALLSNSMASICSSGGTERQRICNSLQAKFQASEAARAAGKFEAAGGSLSALLNELSAQRGKALSETAYYLLTLQVSILREKLP